MRRAAVLSISLAALLLVACAGCGAPPDVNSQLIPVKGKVTYKGKALTSGSVTFEPEAGRAAHAEIKPDGTYEISTFKAGDGAVLGSHKVSIVGSTGKGNANALPAKYKFPSSSKLETDVSADKTDYSFDLK
jgi:hypothetical protein